MLCEKCNNQPASQFLKTVLNGHEQELYVCSKCALQTEKTAKFDLFSNQATSKICKCNTSFEEITQSGYVGCSLCYETYQVQLQPIIAALHAKPYHTGKRKLSKLELYTQQLEKAKQNNFHSLVQKLEKQIAQLKGE